MFNVVPRTSVPGFRVGLVDAVPGFHVDDNAPRSSPSVQPDPDSVSPFGYGPYGGEQRASVGASEISPPRCSATPRAASCRYTGG